MPNSSFRTQLAEYIDAARESKDGALRTRKDTGSFNRQTLRRTLFS